VWKRASAILAQGARAFVLIAKIVRPMKSVTTDVAERTPTAEKIAKKTQTAVWGANVSPMEQDLSAIFARSLARATRIVRGIPSVRNNVAVLRLVNPTEIAKKPPNPSATQTQQSA
jgi:hypothetical protein